MNKLKLIVKMLICWKLEIDLEQLNYALRVLDIYVKYISFSKYVWIFTEYLKKHIRN